jgi:hypothetical protein
MINKWIEEANKEFNEGNIDNYIYISKIKLYISPIVLLSDEKHKRN